MSDFVKAPDLWLVFLFTSPGFGMTDQQCAHVIRSALAYVFLDKNSRNDRNNSYAEDIHFYQLSESPQTAFFFTNAKNKPSNM